MQLSHEQEKFRVFSDFQEVIFPKSLDVIYVVYILPSPYAQKQEKSIRLGR